MSSTPKVIPVTSIKLNPEHLTGQVLKTGVVSLVKPEAPTTDPVKVSPIDNTEFTCQRKGCKKLGVIHCKGCYDRYYCVSVFCSMKCYNKLKTDHLKTHDGYLVPCKNKPRCKNGHCDNCMKATKELIRDFKFKSKQYTDLMKQKKDCQFKCINDDKLEAL